MYFATERRTETEKDKGREREKMKKRTEIHNVTLIKNESIFYLATGKAGNSVSKI